MYSQQPFQQQNMLPFSCSSLNSQPYQFANGQPPFVPNIACPEHIRPYLPVLISSLMNHISSQASVSAPRIFLYNQISNNQYQNNEYITLVATAIDILSLGLITRMYQSVEDGITDCVGKTSVAGIVQAVLMYPAIMQSVNPDQQNAIAQQVRNFQSLQNEIMIMKNGGGQMQQPQMPMNNNFQQSNQGGFGFNGGAGMGRPMNTGFNQATPFVNSGNGGQQADDGRRYSYIKPNQAVQPQPQVRHKPVPLETITKTIVIKPPVEEWKPTLSQPYPLAVNTSPNGLSFNSNSTHQGNDMDRSQHTIAGTTVKQLITETVPAGVATREQAINRSINELVRQTEAMIEVGNTEHDYNSVTIVDNFLESAIFKTRLAQKAISNEDSNCKVFQQQVYIETPIFAPESFAFFVTEGLCEAATFTQAVTLLKERLSTHGIKNDEVTAIMQIDKIFTKEINLILKNSLSLTELSIDSFIDDINELPNYLGDKYGIAYKKALLDIESNFILHNTNFVKMDMANEWFNNNYREVLEGDEIVVDAYCGVVIRSVPYSITVAEIIEEDLNLKLTTRASAHAVQSKDFPALYKLISNSVNRNEAAHHYLMTADNVLFEMHKGLLGKDFYLISKVN